MTTEDDKPRDFPFEAMWKQAQELVESGITVYQKFTCVGCGNRLTMDVPNQFFEQGTCDNCDAVTDIRRQGCNYLVHMVFKPEGYEPEDGQVRDSEYYLRLGNAKRAKGGARDAKQGQHKGRDRDRRQKRPNY